MMRKSAYISLLSVMLLASACGNRRNDWSADSTGFMKSETYTGAEGEINDLDNADWSSPQAYESLRNVKIGEATSLGETDRVALSEGLDKKYADQLVRTQAHILDSDCGPRHTTLYAARKEYEARSKDFGAYIPSGKSDVDARFAGHERQMAFTISSAYPAPASCLAAYDASYDNAKRAEAARIRAEKPTCTVIQQKVAESNVDRLLSARKENYYAALASRFCSMSNPDVATYSRLMSILSASSKSASLKKRVENHWNKSLKK